MNVGFGNPHDCHMAVLRQSDTVSDSGKQVVLIFILESVVCSARLNAAQQPEAAEKTVDSLPAAGIRRFHRGLAEPRRTWRCRWQSVRFGHGWLTTCVSALLITGETLCASIAFVRLPHKAGC